VVVATWEGEVALPEQAGITIDQQLGIRRTTVNYPVLERIVEGRSRGFRNHARNACLNIESLSPGC
jgi:hypothetical protein